MHLNWAHIFQAIILNKIMYALPVYFGYLNECQKRQLQQICDRAKRRFLTLYNHDLEVLAEGAEYKLFHQSCSKHHCLYNIYSLNEKSPGSMKLRTRGHAFNLPFVRYDFNRKNFIVRALCITMFRLCFTCVVVSLFCVYVL